MAAPVRQQSPAQSLGLQTRTRPVALTTTCLHAPAELRSRTRFAPAVPRGENETVPAFVMTTPSESGLIAKTFVLLWMV
jgi:hypothetical protein